MVEIGVLRECKDGERRVALTPEAVGVLVAAGHAVVVESGAGLGAGFSDGDYRAAGAVLAGTDRVWSAQLVVKVKEPQPTEFAHFREGLTLFAFLHLAAEPELAAALCASGVRAYAFEDLHRDGTLPILAPMSQVAGRTAGIVGPGLLSTASGGRGVLAGGVTGADPADAVIVGVGVAGQAAADSLRALGMRVTGIDTDARKLAALVSAGRLAAGHLPGTAEADRAIVAADLLVGAALVPGRRAPQVVSRDQVARMRPGSVVVDIAIDQGGCVETARPTSHSAPTYLESGVLHYCVPNMPGQFPVTATQALSAAVLPPLLALAGAVGGGTETDLWGALAVADGQMKPPVGPGR
jgi:alanine dehydrogenase